MKPNLADFELAVQWQYLEWREGRITVAPLCTIFIEYFLQPRFWVHYQATKGKPTVLAKLTCMDPEKENTY